MFISPLEIVLV